MSIANYFRNLHFIPFQQGVNELKQGMKEFSEDLLIPEFSAMALRTIVKFRDALVGFLNILGLISGLLIALSLFSLAVSAFVDWISHLSEFGIFLDYLANRYLQLILSSAYSIMLVDISIACFIYWWGNKYLTKKEAREKIAKEK